MPTFMYCFGYAFVHGLLWKDVTWKHLVSCHCWACSTFARVCACVCLYVCGLGQGATAVSLCGQPTLLWNVHPDGHYHEQHRPGSWGPRASQCDAQRRESGLHQDFINKHLKVHNKHTCCQTDKHTWTSMCMKIRRLAQAGWGFTHKHVSFGLTDWFIWTDWEVLPNRIWQFTHVEEWVVGGTKTNF